VLLSGEITVPFGEKSSRATTDEVPFTLMQIITPIGTGYVGAATVFVILGASGGMNGVLLWPTALLHAVIGAMMLWVILAAPSKE
jgi:uncharacterized membrane protein YeaQ/YmgE (transglycosylase-associated protein family)